MPITSHSVMALDVGEKRIGVAVASLAAAIASPRDTIDNDENAFSKLKQLAKDENVNEVIVGLPRDMKGNETAQTRISKEFARELKKHIDLKVHYQDESLTSVKAEEELMARGKPYAKADIDALAATYILEDWLAGRITQTEAL